MGVANERSIAWGIAKACHDAGAKVAFTFQGEALEKRVRPLASSIGSEIILPCDVSKAGELEAALDAYDQAMAAFYAAQGMKVRGTWSNHSAKRIRDAASLTGRDRLAEALHSLGFPLR